MHVGNVYVWIYIKVKVLIIQSCPTLYDPMDCNLQAPLSMELSRQECWSGWPFPSPGNLPDPEIAPGSVALQTDSLLLEPLGKLGDRQIDIISGDQAYIVYSLAIPWKFSKPLNILHQNDFK